VHGVEPRIEHAGHFWVRTAAVIALIGAAGVISSVFL